MSQDFQFTPENLQRFERIVRAYPNRRAALLPVLHLAQAQHGFITPQIETYVAELLQIPPVDVHEVLTFYGLFRRRPLGRHHIRLCTNLSCWIRGSTRLQQHLRERLAVEPNQPTPDGRFSWEPFSECLGACELAPMMQLDGDFHGELTPQKVDQILERIPS